MSKTNRMAIDILLVVLVFTAGCLSEKQGPLVTTKSGKIRGRYLTSYKGNKYEAYQGIPYALPPIGVRRFSSPVPVEQWSNELQATKLKEVCMQDSPPQLNRKVAGSEDCLYLNVYVPARKSNTSLPVLFYVPGGAFRGGGTTEDQEHYIIDYDVIFVSTQHRLGSLGFLSTEDEVVPGNMGLKDQSVALRWVYDNIEHFGGDRKKITLLGGSSGGMSVHFHYLSPWSKGLFHAGISLSGSALAPSALAKHSREKAIKLGQLLNCTDSDIRQVVQCLRMRPALELVGVQNQLHVWQNMPPGLFAPVVEKSSADPFIDQPPSQILREGQAYDVPWLTGFVSEEGLVSTAGYTLNNTLKYIDENWNSLAPLLLDYLYTIPKEQQDEVSRKIRQHYLGNKPINKTNLHAFTDLLGDRTFSVGSVNAARLQAAANRNPVFFYYYTYRAVDSLTNAATNTRENLGVAHGDDVHLVIKDPRVTPTKSPNDMAMQRLLIHIWTSVAYNRVPDIGIKWPRVTSQSTLHYLHLAGPNDLRVESSDNMAQSKFWNSIGFNER